MNTRQRLVALLPVIRKFPELRISSLEQLEELLVRELGSVDALDHWSNYGPIQTKAIAPRSLYLVCSHNLPISAWQALLRGLLLGSTIWLKPSSSQWLEINLFVSALPAALRSRVTLLKSHSLSRMQDCEAVVAFGRDETLVEIRNQLRIGQRFLGYGHQVSLLWLGKLRSVRQDLIDSVIEDLCTYDQLGCLSPQAIYLESGSRTEEFCQRLATGLAKVPALKIRASERIALAARIQEERALYPQSRQWIPTTGSSVDWTIHLHPNPTFRPSCGYRFIHVHECSLAHLPKALARVVGKISTVGWRVRLDLKSENVFLALGVKRFCPIGQCQQPSSVWHHDGRPQLGDLVTWIDREG